MNKKWVETPPLNLVLVLISLFNPSSYRNSLVSCTSRRRSYDNHQKVDQSTTETNRINIWMSFTFINGILETFHETFDNSLNRSIKPNKCHFDAFLLSLFPRLVIVMILTFLSDKYFIFKTWLTKCYSTSFFIFRFLNRN